jgi:peptidoglycan/xylan/chitin deacetylase (PgdA/CDA1 family)
MDTPTPSLGRPWTPSPLLKASGALHVGALVATVAAPQCWPYALGAVAANHALLAGTGLWPRSTWLGSNWTRLPAGAAARNEVAITIDDGPEPEVTPAVLALLAEHRAHATFFCIGERVERHPAMARAITAAGHTVENHSHHHPLYFSLLGPRRIRDEIARAQLVIGMATGEQPKFFRAPAGLRNPLLAPALTRFDLQLASWTRRGFDTKTGDGETVLTRLTANLRGGDILLLHDGHAARSRSGRPVILEVLPRLLHRLAAKGLTPVTLRAALQ